MAEMPFAASQSLLTMRGHQAGPWTPPLRLGPWGDTHRPAFGELTNPPEGGGGKPTLPAGGTRFLQVNQRKRNHKPQKSQWLEWHQTPLQVLWAAGFFTGDVAHGTNEAKRTVVM